MFSSSPDVRTANLGVGSTASFGGGRTSVFDRLGADPPSSSNRKNPIRSPPSDGQSVLARVVDRTLASLSAEEGRMQQQRSNSRPGALKRVASFIASYIFYQLHNF